MKGVTSLLPVFLSCALASQYGCSDDSVPLDAGQEIDVLPSDSTEDAPADFQLGDTQLEADQTPEANLTPRFEPLGDGFYRMPWPSDHRVTEDGTVELSDFPRSWDVLMNVFVEEYEEMIVGFSTMPVIYIEVDGDIDAVTIPTPSETLSATAPAQLIDLGEGMCGERVPIELRLEQPEDDFYPDQVVMAAPVTGFTLLPERTYGFVLLTTFGENGNNNIGLATPEEFRAALYSEHVDEVLNSVFEPLGPCFEQGDFERDDVAIATVFSTQNPVPELRTLRDFVADPERTLRPVVAEWSLSENFTVEGEYTTYSGSVDMPIFQRGDSPYNVGGGFAYDDAGAPEIQRWEAVPIVFTVPEAASTPLPIFIWNPGAGANLRGHVRQEFPQDMLAAGFAVAKFLPQFHGTRTVPGADQDLHTYNYLNPESARATLRQQAIDTLYFIRVIREAVPEQIGVPELDTDAIVMGGHSQGAEVTAMVAAVEPTVMAYVINGVGCYVSETIVHRTDPFDVQELLGDLFGVTSEIDRFHPLIQLVQLGADVVDPGNYIRYWSGWDDHPAGSSVLIVDGYHDQDVYFTSMDALTIGADAAPIAPAGWNVDPFDVWDRDEEALPIQGNRLSLAGTPITLAAHLDAESDHFTLYDSEWARDLAVHFLVTSLLGAPELVEPQ